MQLAGASNNSNNNQRRYSYALMLLLVGSIFSAGSMAAFNQPSYATHEDVTVEVRELVYEPDEDVDITGIVNEDILENCEDAVEAEIIFDPDGEDEDSVEDNLTWDLNNDGEFDESYLLDDNADEGLYKVLVVCDNDEGMSFFEVDDDNEANDDIDLSLDEDTYDPGDEIEITGEVLDMVSGEEEVRITVIGPDGDEVDDPFDADLSSSDKFEETFDLPDDADHGVYVVMVTYNDENAKAVQLFTVEDEDSGSGGGGSSGPITASLDKSSYSPRSTVRISGEVDGGDSSDEIDILVKNPDGDEIVEESKELESDGSFSFVFSLASDAETGSYTVTLTFGTSKKDLSFGVTTSGSGSSQTSSGFNIKLDKSSYLAGDVITVTGKVPKIVKDEQVSLLIYRPDRVFAGVSRFVDPNTDLTYSATLGLKPDMKVDEDYIVQVSYNGEDVEAKFSITGVAEVISVKVDKPSVKAGETVKITGSIAKTLISEGQEVVIQVYNPEDAAYRFDVITPKSDGTYEYPLVVGGNLGISGKYRVTATYNEEQAKTTFDVAGVSGPIKFDLEVDSGDEEDIISDAIEGEITKGTIKKLKIDVEKKKLLVSIDATEDGQLTIVLPREFIDSLDRDGDDTDYLISTSDIDEGDIGNEDVTVKESETTDETRTLVIDYKKGTDLIEIAGTTVVPEFGPVAALVLAAAIVAIIAVTARFQNRLGGGMLSGNRL